MDRGLLGPVMAPLYKTYQHLLIAFSFNVYIARGFVTNKTSDAEYIGQLFGGSAKENTLHFALHGNMITSVHAVKIKTPHQGGVSSSR